MPYPTLDGAESFTVVIQDKLGTSAQISKSIAYLPELSAYFFEPPGISHAILSPQYLALLEFMKSAPDRVSINGIVYERQGSSPPITMNGAEFPRQEITYRKKVERPDSD